MFARNEDARRSPMQAKTKQPSIRRSLDVEEEEFSHKMISSSLPIVIKSRSPSPTHSASSAKGALAGGGNMARELLIEEDLDEFGRSVESFLRSKAIKHIMETEDFKQPQLARNASTQDQDDEDESLAIDLGEDELMFELTNN